MTTEDAINVFKENFCGLDVYCEIHQHGLCLTEDCEIWWAIKALEQYKADAVEVVRCSYCKWYETFYTLNGNEFRCCCREGTDRLRNSDDYCSYGERKDD